MERPLLQNSRLALTKSVESRSPSLQSIYHHNIKTTTTTTTTTITIFTMQTHNPRLMISPEIISPAKQQVGFGKERGSNLAKPTVTAGALEAVFVPELVQSLQ